VNSGDTAGLLVAAVSAGILGLLSALLKFWMDAKTHDDEHASQLLALLSNRICELEKQNQECLKRDAEQSEKIGYLNASNALLINKIEELKAANK